MTWKATCLYCKYAIELPERPAPVRGVFGSLYYPAPGFSIGALRRLEGHYSGCCDSCSTAIDAGGVVLSLTTSGTIGASRGAQ